MTQSFVIDETTIGGQINFYFSFVAENKSWNFIFKPQVFFFNQYYDKKYLNLE